MAQHARPNVIGHMLDSRAQLMTCSSEVVMTPSSKRPCNHPIDSGPPILFSARADQHAGGLARWWGRRGGGGFGCRTSHPGQVAALPQIGEADEQDAEEEQDIGQREPAEVTTQLIGLRLLLRLERLLGMVQLPVFPCL